MQLADNKPDTLAEGARLAESRGARFVDLNCGCPIHEITRRGLGASLLRKPARLGRLVAAMASGEGTGHREAARRLERGQANVSQVARVCEEAGLGDLDPRPHARAALQPGRRLGDRSAGWRPSAPSR